MPVRERPLNLVGDAPSRGMDWRDGEGNSKPTRRTGQLRTYWKQSPKAMNRPPRTQIEHRSGACRRALGFVFALVIVGGVLSGQEAKVNEPAPSLKPPSPASSPAPPSLQASVAAARERAKMLHDLYATTLEVMHRHYFRQDGSVLPARAMEDVFAEMAGMSGIYANWISVNTKPMSINHEPTTDFEKKAAVELAAGKPDYEYIGKAVYRRATPIPLGSNCVGCHTKMFSALPKTPRFAGLVISIPLKTAKNKER